MKEKISIAPLVTFRIVFGLIMLFGTLRFVSRGWIERLYDQEVYFKFYGFEWIPVLDVSYMYVIYFLIMLGALGITLGLFYRWSIGLFLTAFTYAELVDATNYLNHYYLIILLGLLLWTLPAQCAISLDRYWNRSEALSTIPRWKITILQFQLGLVYFFAGFAKLNPDWLFHGMPLAIWLPEHAHWPLIGKLFTWEYGPILFSWMGALYDLTIPLWLSLSQTRIPAYIAVIGFHGLTGMLFNIGLFPLIMTASTLIFFPPAWHEAFWSRVGFLMPEQSIHSSSRSPLLAGILVFFFGFQLVIPLRHFALPGNVLWNEAGYRFSWRVMLVEKHGHARFTVYDACSERKTEIRNADYLSEFQEKNMAIQPDFILQYARLLEKTYSEQFGFCDPVVQAESFVSLNGRPSQRFVREGVNLTGISPSQPYSTWIKPLRDE